MGQKDITEKILEAYNDVFSDVVNVILFDGEVVLKPDELEEQASRSAYKADGKYREIERDVAREVYKVSGTIGITNNSSHKTTMILNDTL